MRGGVALLVLVVGPAAPATAQWHIGLELSTTHYRGSSHVRTDTGGPTTIRPANATTFAIRVNRGIGRARLGMQASYARVGLTVAAPDLTLTDNSVGRLFEGQLLLNFRVVGIGSSGAVKLELGPSLHLWKAEDEVRSRAGAVGSGVRRAVGGAASAPRPAEGRARHGHPGIQPARERERRPGDHPAVKLP